MQCHQYTNSFADVLSSQTTLKRDFMILLSLSLSSLSPIDSHFVQRPFRTKTTSYKGDHFVQKHRSHFEQGFFVRGGTWNIYFTYTPRNRFIQRLFRTKTNSYKGDRTKTQWESILYLSFWIEYVFFKIPT